MMVPIVPETMQIVYTWPTNMKQRLKVLFEDKWIAVVSKPSGMLSVGYPGYRGKSAQDVLNELAKGKGKRRSALVHRLDRDTSGVMMFAWSAEAKERIMDEWKELVTERVYRCVCERVRGAEPLKERGTIDAPIAYNAQDVGFVPRPSDREHLKKAESAVTHYRVVHRGPLLDLVECTLDTGRKNQIRIHLAHLGHPILGDEVYGTKGEEPSIGRLALHARLLAFTHPFTGDPCRFEEEEPHSFKKVVDSIPSSRPRDAEAKGEGAPQAAGRRPKEALQKTPHTRIDPYQKEDRSPKRGRHPGGSKFIPK
jgi:23S rRNA pseudouridine1911/1915/1917 synthase